MGGLDRVGARVWERADVRELFGFGGEGEDVGGCEEGEGELAYCFASLFSFQGKEGEMV